MDLKLILGITSGVLYTIGTLPYIYLIIIGKVKPQRASWLIWLLMAVVLIANSHQEHIVFFYGFQGICCLFIFLLSIKNGIGGVSKFDIFSVVICIVALFAKVMLSNGLLSVSLASLIESIAFALSFKKLLKHPGTENLFQWTTSAVAGVIALISLSNFSAEQVMYPVVIIVGNGLVSGLIFSQGKRQVSVKN